MVTPAAQDTTMCLAWTSAPISSRMKGIMCGFTARNRTSLCLTVSLLLRVRFTPIFCGRRLPSSQSPAASLGPGHPPPQEQMRSAGAAWNSLPCPYRVCTYALYAPPWHEVFPSCYWTSVLGAGQAQASPRQAGRGCLPPPPPVLGPRAPLCRVTFPGCKQMRWERPGGSAQRAGTLLDGGRPGPATGTVRLTSGPPPCSPRPCAALP